MASRVNVRFVTILATVLLMLFMGMAATAWFVLRKSAADQIRLGDEAMAVGDYKTAQERYGRAVSRDRANPDYYELYHDAIILWNPEQDAIYRDAFFKSLGARERIAALRQTDVDAHHAYLGAHLRLAEFGADRARWEYVAGEAEHALANFEYAESLDEETARRWPALRRYRALAYKELVAGGHTITSEETERTVADFEAAIAADPTDIRAVLGFMHWHAIHAERAGDSGRRQEAAAAFEQARAVIAAGLAASPGHPELLISEIQLEEQFRSSQIDRLAAPMRRYEQQRQIAADLTPKFEVLVEHLNAIDPEAINQRVIMRLRGVERYFQPEARNEFTARVIDRALAANPDDSTLRLIRGSIDADFERYEEAIEQFQVVVDAPRPPVSLEGVLADELRVEALHRQARAAISMTRDQRSSPAAAEASLARAAGFRDELADRLPAGTPLVKLLDAEIALLKGDASLANRELTEYTREAGRNERSIRLHAEVYDRLNQPGAARDEIKRLTEISPRSAGAFYQLGRIERRLQNWPAAEAAYARAVELAPWNEEYAEEHRQIRVLAGREKSEDPIENAIADSASFDRPVNRLPPEPERARKILLDAIGVHGDDPRLIQALVRHYMINSQRDLAAQTAIDAAERNPEDQYLAALADNARLALRSVDEQLAVIDAADIDEETRLASRYDVLQAAGRTEEAQAAVDALARLNPDNRLALELKFIEALRQRDYSAAEQIAERAGRADADFAGGLTFRGRLLMEQGRNEQAAQALSEAVARGAASVEVRRLLAAAQVRLGQQAAATATLRQALAARPGDLQTIMQMLGLLINQQQHTEALRIARESERVGGHDADFVHVWMDLEARAGDKEVARNRREMILREIPEDRRNRLSLARLYVDTRNPRAPELISALRAEEESLAAVDLDARWRFAQGSLDNARQVYREYITQLDRSDSNYTRAWLAFASLLSSSGDTDGAIAVLRDAREALGDEGVQADLMLARLYAGLGRFGEAADAYQRIMQTGFEDPEGRLRISRAESLTLAGQGQRAVEALDELPPDLRVSAPAQVVRADAIRLLGRQREADELLDSAIARTPTFAGGFLKRGQLSLQRYRESSEDTVLLDDAITDLNRSIELDPSLWPAYQVRAEARLLKGSIDEAIRDVDRAIAINPSLSNLRLRLLDILLQQERFSDASRLANNAATTQSTDLPLLQAIGDRLVDAGREQQAIELYNTAWNTSRSPGIAARMVELLIHGQRPDIRRAREILAEGALGIEQSPMLLMLRAQLESKAGRPTQMREDASRSLALVLDKPSALSIWIQQSERLFENKQEWVSFLRNARLDRAPGGWGAALLGAALAKTPETIEEALPILQQASTSASDPAAAAAASRDLGSANFSLGRHEAAVAGWKRALELRPDDSATSNNIAFTLADALGRPEEALPFALAAAEREPENPAILDTLGVVQMRTGQLAEASETLESALHFAAGRPDRMAPVLLHLAQLEAERGNKRAAEDYLTRARESIGANMSESYRDLITTIQTRIDQL